MCRVLKMTTCQTWEATLQVERLECHLQAVSWIAVVDQDRATMMREIELTIAMRNRVLIHPYSLFGGL